MVVWHGLKGKHVLKSDKTIELIPFIVVISIRYDVFDALSFDFISPCVVITSRESNLDRCSTVEVDIEVVDVIILFICYLSVFYYLVAIE